MMLKFNLVKTAGRIGDLSRRGLKTISKFEKDIGRYDKEFTAGVAGELYKASPLKPLYEANNKPVKTGLKLVSQVSKAVETGKTLYAVKGVFDLVDKYDPLLRTSSMPVNPLYRVGQSPFLNRYLVN